MKLQVKPLLTCCTLKGEAFDLEVDPSITAEVLKAMIFERKPDMPAELQKVLHKGKVLQDEQTLEDRGVVDGDFVVIMMTKPKDPAPPPAPPAAEPESAAASAASADPAAPPAPALPAPAAPAAAGPGAGAVDESQVQILTEMGFPADLVRQCLRAAFGHPDRAVEYLTSGIPTHLQHLASGRPPPPKAPPAPPSQPGFGGAMPQMSRPMPAQPADTGPLAALANNPRFNALRQAVQQHPSTLNQVLTLIHKGDPNMINLIAENQEEFVRLLAQPLSATDPISWRALILAVLAAALAGHLQGCAEETTPDETDPHDGHDHDGPCPHGDCDDDHDNHTDDDHDNHTDDHDHDNHTDDDNHTDNHTD
ncbi:RAD23B [Symbiodinium natans]|uniref:RAD23B protein n=1 Tax=Symbiodinium natans TaxID=878477 RepID=A0A812QP31_9DINO|nr:RAD23B [Symbiodinium natans]